MALVQHSNLQARFKQQVENSREYLIPFIEEVIKVEPGIKVLEIGCGEGGVLQPFIEKGAWCLGVDLSESRINNARLFLETEIMAGKIDFIAQDVYESAFKKNYTGQFDLILLKDTIEHIPNQSTFIPYITNFLSPTGKIFFGFPPWYMPFGGHQQICKSKVLGFLPYYHLLPRSIYKGLLTVFGEPKSVLDELMDIKSTGISIERFESIIKKNDLSIELDRFFLFNPIYKFKFGLRPRLQARWLKRTPYFRNFLTTAVWYLISNKNSKEVSN